MSGISKESFEKCDTNPKLDILFDLIKDIYDLQAENPKACDKRFVVLENRKLRDTAASGMFGLLGGFLAVIFKKIAGL